MPQSDMPLQYVIVDFDAEGVVGPFTSEAEAQAWAQAHDKDDVTVTSVITPAAKAASLLGG